MQCIFQCIGITYATNHINNQSLLLLVSTWSVLRSWNNIQCHQLVAKGWNSTKLVAHSGRLIFQMERQMDQAAWIWQGLWWCGSHLGRNAHIENGLPIKWKCDKSYGNDGLAAEHYKNADYKRLSILLSIFYTSVIVHGYLPTDLMKTIIVPIAKNKNGDSSDVNNYRPIALVTIASKIFEVVLLNFLEPYLLTRDNQFGFKKGHSTEHCLYVLKNAIDFYRSHDSPVFTCFFRCQ